MNKILANITIQIILLFSRLPMPLLYGLSDVFYFLMFYLVRYRRQVVRSNLTSVFPDKPCQEIYRIERKFYRHLSDLIFESMKNLHRSDRWIRDHVIFKNLDLLQSAYSSGQNVVLYTGHSGNWEWLAVLPLLLPYRMVAFYKPLSNSVFDAMIKRSRQQYGIQAVPAEQAYKFLKTLNENGILTLTLVLGDQSPPPGSTRVWVDFLGRPTAFVVGAGKIAQRLGYRVIFPRFRKPARGIYEVEFTLMDPETNPTDGHPYIRGYARCLETSIREEPSLWLWSHRRWKLKPETNS